MTAACDNPAWFVLLNVTSVFHKSISTGLKAVIVTLLRFQQVLPGLKHLQVMHMDLKASNVLLTKTNSIAKIGDVDGAQVMGSTTLQRPRAATFAYSAPELILNGACTEKVSLAFHTDSSSRKATSPHFGVNLMRTQEVYWAVRVWLQIQQLVTSPGICMPVNTCTACTLDALQPCCGSGNPGRTDLQVDMYSFGVILWELITTEVPRRGRLRGIKVRSLTHLLVQL